MPTTVNGSARDIAGIVNEAGNVLGMMPHPERVVEPAHGGTDGRRLFEGLLEAASAGRPEPRSVAGVPAEHLLDSRAPGRA